jgi:hypothetical protein
MGIPVANLVSVTFDGTGVSTSSILLLLHVHGAVNDSCPKK